MGSSKKRKKRRLNRFDQVILKYIPKLFEILGWVAILGVLQYVSIKSNDYWIWIIYFVSLLGIMYYIQVYLYYEIFLKFKTRNSWLTLLSLILTAIFGIGTYLFLQRIIDLLAVNN